MANCKHLGIALVTQVLYVKYKTEDSSSILQSEERIPHQLSKLHLQKNLCFMLSITQELSPSVTQAEVCEESGGLYDVLSIARKINLIEVNFER
uniref:Uncharacterized protein n=1 Tax=Megaselia scalaris TaxID=36166 RepID=T1GQ01_MEGSC